jgi:hypothetical protein
MAVTVDVYRVQLFHHFFPSLDASMALLSTPASAVHSDRSRNSPPSRPLCFA